MQELIDLSRAEFAKEGLPTFHYALKPGGFLLLGASESIGSFTDLFEPADKKHKLYSKKSAPTPAFHLPVRQERGERPSPGLRPPSSHLTERGKGEGALGALEGVRGELNAQREADRVTVNQFAPPGVLINADLQILQFRGPTSAYLEPPRGKASFDVLKMAREGLMLPLRAAINKARKSNSTARRDHVLVQQNGKTRTVNLKVIPLKHVRERCFLVVFEDAKGEEGGPGREQPSGAVQTPRRTGTKEASRRIADLETDLAETRDYLQSMQEQHEAANEELQASNEEVQSANEELQSVNEELETSKEELESANEELTTVNEEMANRNSELTRLNSDLVNLQTSIKLVIMLLGRDLTIRRFSAQAEKQFDLRATDVGRPIRDIRHNLRFEERDLQVAPASSVPPRPNIQQPQAGWQVKQPDGRAHDTVDSPPDLETFIADVISTVREREREMRDKEGRWYHLRVRPYFTFDNKVDGAVLVLVDITDLKRNEQAIAAAREYAEATIETVREPLLVLDDHQRIESASRSFYRAFQVRPVETIGKSLYEVGNRQWDIASLRTLLEEILPQNTSMDDFLVEHTFERLGRRSMLLNARRMDDPGSTTQRILLAIEDVTERKQVQEALRESQTQLQFTLDSAQVGDWDLDLTSDRARRSLRHDQAFGYNEPVEEWGFETFIRHVHPEDRLDIERQFRDAVTQQHNWHFECRVIWPDGSVHWIAAHGSPYCTPESQPKRMLGIVADITERKRAEEALRASEERFRSLVSVITDAFWATDAAGAFITPQPAWEAYTGQTWEDYRGFGWANALHPDDRDRVLEIWSRACDTHAAYESRGRLWHASTQQWRHYVARAVPLFQADGSVREWVGTCTDIEELQRSEASLHRSNDELEARVEDRTRELVTSQERLRGLAAEVNLAEQRERQRLAAELHDYLAQLLVLCKIKLAQAKQQPMAPPVAQAVTDMQEVMDKALNYTRTLVAQLSPPIVSQFGLPVALKWLVEQMQQRDLSVSLELESEALPLPEEQSVLLFQSIRELLMNVVKHAGTKEARITLTQAKGTLQITVADQGAGFDLTATAPTAGSSSVPSFGLFSIRERMLALGGHFELRSRPGEGTQATLIVPLTSKAAKAELAGLNDELEANTISRQKPSLDEQHAFDTREEHPTLNIEHSSLPRHVRVLVADDHAMVRQGLRSILDAYQDITVVGEAADGEEAVEMARMLSPDVIIMDVNMPNMDGVEATSRIKAQQPGTLIVGLSLTQSSQVEPLLLQAGASCYVSKDAAVDRLYEAIIAVMKRKTESFGKQNVETGPSGRELPHE